MIGKAIVVLVAVAVVGVGTVAVADTTTVHDGDDTGSALDIADVTAGHARGHQLRYVISMEEPWSNSILTNEGARSEATGISLPLKLKRGEGVDAAIYIGLNEDESLYAEVAGPRGYGYARVWRSDERTLKLEFPERMLGRGLDSYKWKVSTSFTDPESADCGTDPDGSAITCFDDAPDAGFARHRL